MVAGHLQKKRNYWHIVLNLRGDDGKRKQKWISTGLTVPGNKKLAEKMLCKKRLEYTSTRDMRKNSKGIYFDEYMTQWLYSQKSLVLDTTYDSNTYIIKNSVAPFFRKQNILLADIKAPDIHCYYRSLLEKGLSPNTVIRHHAAIHKALFDAYKNDLTVSNIAEKIEPPKREVFMSTPYSIEECNQLLRVIQGEKLETIIILALFTGLRRSEILGLTWKAIDFKTNVIHVFHSVTKVLKNGKYTIAKNNKLKRSSSYRTLPMVEPLKEHLLSIAKNRYNGKTANPDDYICLNDKGDLMKPNYISQSFVKLLKKYRLRNIRFHDLRHSCANLLITSRVPLVEVQQWLGHSSISTTADIYGHLAFETKLQCANVIKKN